MLLLLCWLLLVGCGQRKEPVAEMSATETPKHKVVTVPVEEPKPVETEAPTEAPTQAPTKEPKPVETEAPTEAPAQAPTKEPKPVEAEAPTEAPTQVPTQEPKPVETEAPTEAPTQAPTKEPKPVEAEAPTEAPAQAPTKEPKPVEAEVPTQIPKAEGVEDIHTHEVAFEEKVATCLEPGEKRSYCVTCGVTIEQEYAEPLGHVFEKEVWELPTCQKGGYYNNICTRCGLVECVSQNPLAHEVEDFVLQEGNCMEDTIIQHKCKNCGVQVQEDTRYTNYEVHNWTVGQVDGIEITYCEWCGVAS